MTREEASNILDDYDVNFKGHTIEEIAKAFDVAFRALEQEPILDKIRSEIMAIGNWNTKSELPNGDLEKVLDIIDKYKAESEE